MMPAICQGTVPRRAPRPGAWGPHPRHGELPCRGPGTDAHPHRITCLAGAPGRRPGTPGVGGGDRIACPRPGTWLARVVRALQAGLLPAGCIRTERRGERPWGRRPVVATLPDWYDTTLARQFWRGPPAPGGTESTGLDAACTVACPGTAHSRPGPAGGCRSVSVWFGCAEVAGGPQCWHRAGWDRRGSATPRRSLTGTVWRGTVPTPRASLRAAPSATRGVAGPRGFRRRLRNKAEFPGGGGQGAAARGW